MSSGLTASFGGPIIQNNSSFMLPNSQHFIENFDGSAPIPENASSVYTHPEMQNGYIQQNQLQLLQQQQQMMNMQQFPMQSNGYMSPRGEKTVNELQKLRESLDVHSTLLGNDMRKLKQEVYVAQESKRAAIQDLENLREQL